VPPNSGAPGAIQTKLFTFGFLESRSAIIHRNVRCASGATAIECNGKLQRSPANMNSARTVHVESEQRQKAHQTVNSDCPVPQDVRGSMVKTVRTLPVGLRGWRTGLSGGAPDCPVAHRTVRCAHRQTASPTVGLVVGAINTPNHHHSKYPSFSDISFNTRASTINTRHNSKESKPLRVPITLQTPSD
jgi:hypothetical protein